MTSSGNRFGIGDEAWAKLDDGMRNELARLRDTSEVHVMVSLQPPLDQAESDTVQRKEARFLSAVSDLTRDLERRGGHDIERYWINSTVSVHLPVRALDAIGCRSDVRQILLLVRHKAVL